MSDQAPLLAGKPSTSQHVQRNVRQRAQRACEPCRKRKVKCDGSFPCDVCTGYGYQCSFTPDARRPQTRAPIHGYPEESRAVATSLFNSEYSGRATADSADSGVNAAHDAPVEQSFIVLETPGVRNLALSTPMPEPLRSRFTTIQSAIAFPRDLGHMLGLSDPPRLHSYGWNTGTRLESVSNLEVRIFEQISLRDVLQCSDTYFSVIHPLFGFLDRATYTKACIATWSSRQMPLDVAAVICGVVALGSLFSSSSTAWAQESYVVEQARLSLEMSTSHTPVLLSIKDVLGWLLRALYLRSTTRPHLSWIATCNAMHIAEAIGLHQEFGKIDVLNPRPGEVAMAEAVLRRKTFWVAWSLNRLFSIEYGRSPVYLDSIGCRPMEGEGEMDLTADFVSLCQLLPKPVQNQRSLTEEKEDLTGALQRLSDLTAQAPPVTLLKADVCFSIYRKMRLLNLPLTRAQVGIVTDIIRAALLEAQYLSTTSSKWWSVIGVPFHSVGVLIALDVPAGMGLLLHAMKTLKKIVESYDTHLTREALQTAQKLIQGCWEKKMADVTWLAQALGVVDSNPPAVNENLQSMLEIPPVIEWPLQEDGSWMQVSFDMDVES